MTVVLLCAPVVLTVLRAHKSLRPESGSLIAAIGIGIALATLYVGWATFAGSRAEDTDDGESDLTKVADQLALAVGAQWAREAQIRGLYDPYPLPVRWVAASTSLVDDWNVLLTAATSGGDWPSLSPAEDWAARPDGLAGSGGQLGDVLARVPTGRLVVLGEPGAGKTMLMVRLLLDLLARRSSNDPVPVLVPIASWNPTRQDLHAWLAARLVIDYPSLGAAPSGWTDDGTYIDALLRRRLILPILDGLDEIPAAERGTVIAAINDAILPGEYLVLTCRTEPYREAVFAPGAAKATLRSAAGIQLCPLDVETIVRYLQDDSGGTAGEARWERVIVALKVSGPVKEALSTPLMVGLARVIYNGYSGERLDTLPDPSELCKLADRSAIEARLFQGFIRAAYRPAPAAYRRGHTWSVKKAEEYLAFLAAHLEYRIKTPDLAWWELARSLPIALVSIVTGLTVGLVAAVTVETSFALAGSWFGSNAQVIPWFLPHPLGHWAGFEFGLKFGLSSALKFGLAVGVMAGFATFALSEEWHSVSVRIRWIDARSEILDFIAHIATSLITGFAVTVAIWTGLRGPSFRFGTTIGVVTSIAIIALTVDISALQIRFPWSLWHRFSTIHNQLAARVPAAVAAGSVAGVAAWSTFSSSAIIDVAIGVATGVATAAFVSGDQRVPEERRQNPWRIAGGGVAAALIVSVTLLLLGQASSAVGAGAVSGIIAAGIVMAMNGHSRFFSYRTRWRLRAGLLAGLVIMVIAQSPFKVIIGLYVPYAEFIILATGFAAGLAVAVMGGTERGPARGVHWNARRGILAGLAAAIIIIVNRGSAPVIAVIEQLPVAIAGGLVFGLQMLSNDAPSTASPVATLIRDRGTKLVLALAAGIVCGVATGVWDGQASIAVGVIAGIGTGFAVAVIFGITVIGFGGAWPSWIMARTWLAIWRQTPFSLLGFMSDAHRRGVLRQVGAVYQFRHIELQRLLSGRDGAHKS